jgi:hypothetical protein
MIDVVAYLTGSYELLLINQKSPGSNPATPITYRLSNRGFFARLTKPFYCRTVIVWDNGRAFVLD